MTFPDLVRDPKAGRSVPYWVHSSLDFEQEVDYLSSDSLRARSNYDVVVPAIDVAVVVDIALVPLDVVLVLFDVALVLFVVALVLFVVVLVGIGID